MDPMLAPDKLLAAYASGIFPMADDSGEIHWLAPNPRAIMELDGFKTTRSLRGVLRRNVFTVTVDHSFDEVIRRCADRAEGTWIADDIREAYSRLHRLGFGHSVEAWRDGELAGGLYGVAIGGAFFGESMFRRVPDASKVALVHLVEQMKSRGFVLLDVQFMTEHLRRHGAVEVSREDYERRLARAITLPCTFVDRQGVDPQGVNPESVERQGD